MEKEMLQNKTKHVINIYNITNRLHDIYNTGN
jgi:hypothetical protein